MRRRDLFAMLVGAAVAQPAGLRAQVQKKIVRLGFLGFGRPSAWSSQLAAFRTGLRDLGYVEGENVVIEFRWAQSVDQLPELAAQLVGMDIDVIIAPASTEVEPARQATKTIPIVFVQHADPVGLGHVASLARPGGNITGISMVLPEIAVKALQIFKDFKPSAVRIGVLWNPTTPSHMQVLNALRAVAEKIDVQLLEEPVRAVTDFEGAFSMMAAKRADGFLVPSSPLTNSARVPLADVELKYRLPGIFVNKENVEVGGLMSYGADFDYMYRHAALFVAKILKGEKAADLPVEQASKYELVINLKTAKAIGVTVPPTLLARADEVIE